MEKMISKSKGVVKANGNAAIESLLKNDAIIERMVDYMEAATCTRKSNEEVRKTLRAYVRGMLEAARV